jgi:acid phosphatase (class A)
MSSKLPMAMFAMCAAAGAVIAQPPTSSSAPRPSGYLASGEFDVTSVLQSAPQPGDARYEADRAIFRETRKLVGTPRYKLAESDVAGGSAAMLRNFSCAAGIMLTPEKAPRLMQLMQRASVDTGMQTGRAKEHFKRERPYLIDQGQTCQPPEQLFDKRNNRASYDYPSGHTTHGWTYALVLAAVMPDRAQQILQRGRAYGESRYICGVHNLSAVDAGMLSASATMTVVQSKPSYQDDLKAARAEMESLRASGTAPAACDAENVLVAQAK